MHNYILIGAAGYIAPRHMEAIKVNGGNLLSAYDPFDSVGVIDRYFPGASFFTEFERFDRFVDLQIRNGISIDYVVICRPDMRGLPGVYKKQQYTLLKSYNKLFKEDITVDILGCIPASDIIQTKATDYSPFLLSLDTLTYL